MRTLDEYLQEANVAHGHMCAGQVLGIRLAQHGLAKLGIDDPRGKDRKRLVTFIEIDRCATDAIALVTGSGLGKRSLKFRDWGKMAATFVDLESGRGVRVTARDESKARARELYPDLSKNDQQLRAYRELSDDELFTSQWVRVDVGPEEMPTYKGDRIVCEQCKEGIAFRREVVRDGRTLCRACAGEAYYTPAEAADASAR